MPNDGMYAPPAKEITAKTCLARDRGFLLGVVREPPLRECSAPIHRGGISTATRFWRRGKSDVFRLNRRGSGDSDYLVAARPMEIRIV
jgi:hypothetical protein